MFRIPAIILLIFVASWAWHPVRSEATHYTIATGSKGATFYPLAKAICKEVARLRMGFTCEAVSTPGSGFNLKALQRGDFDLAFSQSFLLARAAQGEPPFTDRHDNIRAIATLHLEVFTLAIRPNSGVIQLDDLLGRRVNIGNQGSGSRATIEQLLQSLDWSPVAFSVHELKSADLPAALCGGQIDAAIYSTGHPNDIYRRMIDDCDVRLVDLWSDKVEKFVDANWQYESAVLPAHTYSNQSLPVRGFGTRVILSGSVSLPDCHVAGLLRAIREGRVRLLEAVPAARSIPLEAETDVPGATTHPGVLGGCAEHPTHTLHVDESSAFRPYRQVVADVLN